MHTRGDLSLGLDLHMPSIKVLSNSFSCSRLDMENGNASGTIIERNKRLKRRNEQDRARRAEESPQQKQERLCKRRERERAILPQLKQE